MKIYMIVLMALAALGARHVPAQAASQNECAIWLCLPAGFPAGCSGARAAFMRRLKKRWSPLPPLSSCGAGGQEGRYQFGYEPYESCREGYVLRTDGSSQSDARCYQADCAPIQRTTPYFAMGLSGSCSYYRPDRRRLPHYIDLWINGASSGRYYYQ